MLDSTTGEVSPPGQGLPTEGKFVAWFYALKITTCWQFPFWPYASLLDPFRRPGQHLGLCDWCHHHVPPDVHHLLKFCRSTYRISRNITRTFFPKKILEKYNLRVIHRSRPFSGGWKWTSPSLFPIFGLNKTYLVLISYPIYLSGIYDI